MDDPRAKYGNPGLASTRRGPPRPAGEVVSSTVISPQRARSHAARPFVPSTSTMNEFGRPQATREHEKVPTAPEAKRPVKVATSSFSTSSMAAPSPADAVPLVT